MWQVITGDYYNCPYPFRRARTPRRVKLCARAGDVSMAIRPVVVIIMDRFARMPRATPMIFMKRPDVVNALVTRGSWASGGVAVFSDMPIHFADAEPSRVEFVKIETARIVAEDRALLDRLAEGPSPET